MNDLHSKAMQIYRETLDTDKAIERVVSLVIEEAARAASHHDVAGNDEFVWGYESGREDAAKSIRSLLNKGE